MGYSSRFLTVDSLGLVQSWPFNYSFKLVVSIGLYNIIYSVNGGSALMKLVFHRKIVHNHPGTGPKVGTALMMVSPTLSREIVFGRGKLAISWARLLLSMCEPRKRIERSNPTKSADLVS